MPSVPSPSVASPALFNHSFWSETSWSLTADHFPQPLLSLPCWRVCYCAGEALMGSGHILGHLMWQSGLHQRSGLLLICCLCKCPPWARPRLFQPHAALGQLHLCFPESSCLPGHGRPCSSANRPHGVSRACVSVSPCWENRHPQMRSQSVLFIVAWEQAPEHMLLEGGVRASYRLPVSPHSPVTI